MSRRTVSRACAVCPLPAFFVAAAVCSYAGTSDYSTVFGAQVAGCKAPCSTGNAPAVIECLDGIEGEPCDNTRCTNNEVRIVQCAVGNPGAEEQPCKTKSNNGDWWRRATVRREPCTGTRDPETGVAYGNACTMDGGGATHGFTPCRAAACATGPINSVITYAPKPECDT